VGRRASYIDQSQMSLDHADLMFEDIDFTKDTPYLVLMRTIDVLIQGKMPPVKHVSGIILLCSPFACVTIVAPFRCATVGLTLTPPPRPAALRCSAFALGFQIRKTCCCRWRCCIGSGFPRAMTNNRWEASATKCWPCLAPGDSSCRKRVV
jgi:hypothetical protein